jgi:hypothetical protein
LRGRIRKVAGKSLVILKWIQYKSLVNLNHRKSFYINEGTLIVEEDVMIFGLFRCNSSKTNIIILPRYEATCFNQLRDHPQAV